MGSYPFTSKTYDRFEIYTEKAIGSHSDKDYERRLYDEWMAQAEEYLEALGPLVQEILDQPDLPMELTGYDKDLISLLEDEEWPSSPFRLRIRMHDISDRAPDIERLDVILALSTAPEKDDIDVLRERLTEAAKSQSSRGGLNPFRWLR